MHAPTEERLAAWEQRTAWLLTGLAMLFLVAYAAPILRPDLPPGLNLLCHVATVLIWVSFGVDYGVKLWLSDHRGRYVRRHLFDLAVLLLPLVGPLRILRLITPLAVIGRQARVWTKGRLAVYLSGTGTLLILVAALAVLDTERGHPDASITSFPEALWWSVVTVTTVGYGDYYPVTVSGRLVAAALMIGGIGLIGFVTGSLASWVIQRIQVVEESGHATQQDVAALLTELAAVRAELEALRESRAPDPVDD